MNGEINATDTDDLVAKIGQRRIDFADLIDRLIVSRHWPAIEDCLDQVLIEDACEKHGLTASEDEIHAQVTNFRKSQNLISGEDTRKWLEAQHLEEDDFLRMCQFEVCLQKLKDLLFAHRLEQEFVYKKVELQEVELYKIVVAQEQAAREIMSLVKEGASFFDYARKYSLDSETSKACGYLGRIKIKSLPIHLQDALSRTAPGGLLGPLATHKTFEIYLVDVIHTPSLDAETSKHLQNELFAEWLTDIKLRAPIEFFV